MNSPKEPPMQNIVLNLRSPLAEMERGPVQQVVKEVHKRTLVKGALLPQRGVSSPPISCCTRYTHACMSTIEPEQRGMIAPHPVPSRPRPPPVPPQKCGTVKDVSQEKVGWHPRSLSFSRSSFLTRTCWFKKNWRSVRGICFATVPNPSKQ